MIFSNRSSNPVLHHLQKSNLQAQEIAAHYFDKVNDTRGYLYRYRNEYEATSDSHQ